MVCFVSSQLLAQMFNLPVHLVAQTFQESDQKNPIVPCPEPGCPHQPWFTPGPSMQDTKTSAVAASAAAACTASAPITATAAASANVTSSTFVTVAPVAVPASLASANVPIVGATPAAATALPFLQHKE